MKNTDDIDKIAIRSDSIEILLMKEAESWRLNNMYAVKKDAINLVLAAMQRLEIIAPIPRSYQALAAKKLENTGKFVEISAGSRIIRAFYIDYDTSEIKGTIILNHKARIPFLVKMKGFSTSNISKIFSTDFYFWRDNTLFSYQPEDIASVSISYADSRNRSFKIIYDSERQPHLINQQTGKQMNEVELKSLSDYLYYFSNINYLPSDADAVNVLATNLLIAEITIEGKKMNNITVSLYKRPLEEISESQKYDLNYCYGKINNEKELVLIKYFDIDPILRELNDFIKK